jgi:hypothetical protein
VLGRNKSSNALMGAEAQKSTGWGRHFSSSRLARTRTTKHEAAHEETEALRRWDGRSVLPHLTPYFYKQPVRIWPICRPEGAVGTYSPRCRGQWSYNILWPLCSLWWGENWPGGASGTDPPKICDLECASTRASARSMTWELGAFLLHTSHLRTVQFFLSAR